MDALLQAIETAGRLLVTTHADPDGDAVGSLLAMGLGLTRLGKQVAFYVESPIPAVYQFLPAVERIRRRLPAAACDAAVVLDCGDGSRVGEAWEAVSRIPAVLNIDHHVSNTGFGTHRLIEGTACATAEIVYHLIRRMGVRIDRDIATCIYTGILTDTGSFRFSNTNAAAFAICREMIELGVEPHEVARYVYGSYSLGRIKLLNLALNSIELSPNGKLSLMTVTRGMLEETQTQPEDADGLINYVRRIEDVRVAALIQEQVNGRSSHGAGGRYHVSLRSDGSVDVAAFAGTYGGGGHRNAAGFQIDGTLADIKAQLLDWAEHLGGGAENRP
ncbi:MAG: bifunctional oligoribonuclease/PAP phosphatase NrnA [Desulfobacterales bacterium]|jgi:phosphoesterase RecJ-like protein|nr:bifunctional oligoribonuclease/PAP phosphatase NrnA [Desulfobacterales bacterium]